MGKKRKEKKKGCSAYTETYSFHLQACQIIHWGCSSEYKDDHTWYTWSSMIYTLSLPTPATASCSHCNGWRLHSLSPSGQCSDYSPTLARAMTCPADVSAHRKLSAQVVTSQASTTPYLRSKPKGKSNNKRNGSKCKQWMIRCRTKIHHNMV